LYPAADPRLRGANETGEGTREELGPTAKLDKLPAHLPDSRAVVLREVGNRLEVRRKPPDQPHQFDIALRFAFQWPARFETGSLDAPIFLLQPIVIAPSSCQ